MKFYLEILVILVKIFPLTFRRSIINDPKKILISQTSKLGDMVCTTPLFRAVKQKYPDCEVWVIGDETNEEILEGNPNIDGYIVYEDFSKTSERIKKHNFDFACTVIPNFKVLATLINSGVKSIAAPKIVEGKSPHQTWSYAFLSLFAHTYRHKMGVYNPREYLRSLEFIDIKISDTKKDLYFSKEAGLKIDEMLSGYKGKKIAISPSAGNKIKNWGGKNFAKVADEIYKRWGADIFVIGGPRDKDEVKEMMENLSPDTKVVDMSMRLNIDELKAFMSKMDLFIAVDTGPIYIAEAFGVPTVDIIGPMDEREQPPVGPKHRVVYLKNRRAPALHIMNARMYDVKEARRQIEEITPEMVISEIDNIILTTQNE